MDSKNEESITEPEIFFSDAIRFFMKVTPNGKCFACGQDSWLIPYDGRLASKCYLVSTGSHKSGIPTFDLNLECSTCGLIRQHRADTIINWLAENPSVVETEK